MRATTSTPARMRISVGMLRGSRSRRFTRCLPHFFDARLAADLASEVVQFCLPDLPLAQNVDALNARRVQWEGPLHSHAVADAAHGERLAWPAALPADDDALEGLDALAPAFHDPEVHAHGIPRRERRDFALQLLALELIKSVHDESSERHTDPNNSHDESLGPLR